MSQKSPSPDAENAWEFQPRSSIEEVRDPNAPVQQRLDAIFNLLEHFEPPYLQELEGILNNPEENTEVRSAIALTLAKIGHAGAHSDEILSLLGSLVTAADPTLRNYCVQALGVLGRVESAPWLIETLKDSNKVVFASAAEALGKLGRPVVPFLLELLQTGAEDAKCVAAWQLGELSDRSAVTLLSARIRQESSQDVVALCIWALGKIEDGPPEAIEALLWAKAQPEPELRLRAELALKKIARNIN